MDGLNRGPESGSLPIHAEQARARQADCQFPHRRPCAAGRLLRAATANPNHVDHGAYDRFRSGLLRHIGMEEKILLSAIQRLRGGEPLPIAAKLRLDHGALASLLMPPPTAAVLAAIRTILAAHNPREEGSGGLYAICDELAGAEAGAILDRLREAPEVAVMPHSDSPAVMAMVRNACARAGYAFGDPEFSSEPRAAKREEPESGMA